MHARIGQMTSGLFSMLVLAVLPTGAAERIASVYLESPAALQQQVQEAALVFDVPELGMFPMMMMAVPGGSQVKISEPVALHVFDMGGGLTAGVLELTPASTAEMFLKSLTANSDKPLAPAVDGRYTFENGVAQMRGARLLLARTDAELDACTGGAVSDLPPMPAIPGVIRVAMAPSAAVPMLEAAKSDVVGAMAAGGPEAVQTQAVTEMMFGLYTRTLAQLHALNMGIGVQPEGLMVRSKLVPVSGSTVADILASMQPVDSAYLAFVQQGTILSMASGRYTLSDQLKSQLVSLYVKMIKTSALTADIDADELAFVMGESIEALGAAMAWSAAMTPDGQSFRVQGAMGVQNAVSYLEKMMTWMHMPVMQTMTDQSGFRMEASEKRMYKEYPVYNLKVTLDDAALRKQMGAAGQDANALAGVNMMMALFGSGYAYAATPKGVTFGLGSPSMVEQAADRLMDSSPDVSEATRIRALLAPSDAPVVIGRFGLLDAVRAGVNMVPMAAGTPLPAAMAALPVGEGIVFADWLSGSEVNSALLIPAADIKALSAMVKRIQAAEQTED